MDIPFTQFLRPDGKRVPVNIDRPDDIAALAQTIMRRGFEFHVEWVPGNFAALSIHNTVTGEDDVFRLVRNGPKVPEAVDELIRDFIRRGL